MAVNTETTDQEEDDDNEEVCETQCLPWHASATPVNILPLVSPLVLSALTFTCYKLLLRDPYVAC